MMTDPVLIDMLQLLSVSLNRENPFTLSDMSRWQKVKKELQAQAVLSLVSDTVMQAELSSEEKLELMKTTAVNVRTFHRLMSAQTALLKLLETHRISAVVVKGAAAAQYYARPELRSYGDIDILVLPEDYEKAFSLLLSAGYRSRQSDGTARTRHSGFGSPEGAEVELHRWFSNSRSKKENALLDGWLFAGIPEARIARTCGYEASVLPPVENGLVLLAHINQHLSKGLGLRQIVDWMLFVQAEVDDTVWKEQFEPRAAAIGMAYLAETVTKMCQMYLGLGTEFTWCAGADEKLAEELMRYICSRGNFGEHIDRDSHGTRDTVHMLSNPTDAFRYLTKAGEQHMAEAGLKPRKAVAWLYQLGHLLLQVFRRRKSGNLVREFKTGARETDLLKRLKVTRL